AGSKYFGKTSETYGVTSLTNARSISMWVKLRTEAPTAAYPTGCYGINVWTTKINGGNAMSYGLDYGDGQLWGHTAGTKWLRAYQYGYNEYFAEYQIALGITNWHHVVWTYAGNGTSNLKLYIDGSLVSQCNPSDGGSGWGVYPASNRGFIGMDNTNTPGYFDEVGFWSRALTAAEVTSLYNSGAGWQYPFIVATVPTVTTQAVTNITATTATGNGNVTADGGATIIERGLCWNTSSTPTTANSKATSAGTTGAFNASMTGLTIGTLYYVRAYAINSVGISYGDGVTFTTLNSPSVTTQAVTSITSTTATANGNVSADGGATITERGVCWNTSTTPTTANSKATSSGTTGAFTASMSGLTNGTLYYVRAYAINSVGISYGNQVTFTTLIIPTVTSPTASNITVNTATLGANITSDGGAAITARGTCWGTSANPTANCIAEGNTATGVFTQARTGLPAGTLIYYRGYATNSVGTGYSADGTFTTFTPATVNWNNSNVQEITLTANRSFTFTNGRNGALYTLFIKQNNTGGFSIIWPADIRWTGGTAPTLITTPNSIANIRFAYDGSNYFEIGVNQY
ncbi:MAG: LamG domain-containing protein, partial [Bacteroidetes bacterium]|nr:LamG domain-containing protein [Bacteroidota bacterium]